MAKGWKPGPIAQRLAKQPVQSPRSAKRSAGKAPAGGGWTPGPIAQALAPKVRQRYSPQPEPQGVLGQIGDIVEGLPSALLEIGKGAVDEFAIKPWEHLASGAEGLIAGNNKSVLENIGDVASGVPAVGALGRAGFEGGKAFLTEKPSEDAPLSSGFGESFRHTTNRLTDPGQYVQAYKDGRIVGTVLEDVANLSLVAGGAAGGVNKLTGGAARTAFEAGRAVEGAEKAVSTLEGKLAEVNAQEASIRQAAEAHAKAVGKVGADPIAGGQFNARLEEVLRQKGAATEALDAAKRAVESHKATQLQALSEAGSLARPYRLLKGAQHLGDRGSMAIAAPYAEIGKVAGKALRAAMKASPELEQALSRFVSLRGAGEIRNVQQAIATGLNESQGHGLRLINRELGGDPHLFTAMILDLTGTGKALLEARNQLRAVDPAAADELVQQVAANPLLDVPAEALQTAMDLAEGKAPAEVADRIRVAQEIYHDKIGRPNQAQYLEGYGAKRMLSPEALEQRQWNVEGRTINPRAVEDAAAKQVAELTGAQEHLAGLEDKAAGQRARLIFDPTEGRIGAQYAEAVAHNAEVAGTVAQDLLELAYHAAEQGDGTLLENLRKVAKISEADAGEISDAAFASKLAAALEGKVGKNSLINALPPEVGRAVREADFVPVKAVPGAGAERAFGRLERASGERAVAKRLGAAARRIRVRVQELLARGVSAQDVARVKKRALEYAEAQANTARAADAAGFARDQARAGVAPRLPAELPDHMVDLGEYQQRLRKVEGQGSLNPEVDHARMVLAAVDEARAGRGNGVPPWVIDDLRWRRSAAQKAGESYPAEWDSILDGSRAATERFRHTAEGRVLAAARDEVRATHAALLEHLKANQRAFEDEWLARTQGEGFDLAQPFVPDGVFEDDWRYFGEQFSPRPAAGRPSNILDRLAEWRRQGGGVRETPAALAKKFAELWKADYNRLSPFAKKYLTLPDQATLEGMYLDYLAHGRFPDRIGARAYDEAFAQATERGLGPADIAQAWADQVTIDYAIRMLENPRLRWQTAESWGHAGDLLDVVSHAAEEAGIDHTAARMVMMGRPLNESARMVMEAQIGRNRLPIEVPGDAATIADELRGAGGDGLYELEVIDRAFGNDLAGAARFFDAWDEAGQPDLADTFDALARGERPTWLDSPGSAAEERAVRAAEERAAKAGEVDQSYEQFAGETPPSRLPGRQGLDPAEQPILDEQVAQAQEKGARRGLERAVAKSGGTERVANELAATGEKLDAQASRAADVAEGLDQARSDAVTAVAGPVAEQMAKEGVKIGDYLRTLREIGYTKRRLARMPERWAREMDRILNDFRNAPARARPALLISQEAGKVLGKLADDAAKMGNDALAQGVEHAQLELMRTVRDIFEPGQLPDGTPLEPMFEPEFVPGGRVRGPYLETQGPNPPPVRLRLAGEQHAKLTSLFARSPEELESVLIRRTKLRVMNETARVLEARFGMRANQVIGAEEVAALREQLTDPAEFGHALFNRMKELGYIGWDPERLYQAIEGGRGVTEETVFLPEHFYKAFQRWYKPAGQYEMAFRRFYDRPTNVWKALVLALSPRWHMNNIVGNALMAMSVGGLDPLTYVKRMKQANALVKHDDLAYMAEHPELIQHEGPLGEWRTARARRTIGRRLERANARIGTIEERTLAMLRDGRGGYAVDPRIPQRGAGVSQIDPTGYAVQQGQGRVARFVRGSYEFNGFFDDVNRLAVWLEESNRLKPADLWQLASKHPELAMLQGVDNLRNEAAVRLSLRAMGDFVSMTPFERQVIRRIFPFYAWLRHITKAAIKLPLYHPARVVWMLHILDMFSEPSEFPLLKNTLPLSELGLGGGPNDFMRLPRFNPYEDVAPISPNIGETLGRSMNPILKLGIAATTGVDTSTWQQYKRPPGTGPMDPYGNEDSDPLWNDPKRLLNLAAGQVPQVRVLQGVKDSVEHGGPLLRLPTGEPQRAYTQPILAGSGAESGILGYAGLPYPQTFDVASMRLLKLRRGLANDKKRRRYFGPAGQ